MSPNVTQGGQKRVIKHKGHKMKSAAHLKIEYPTYFSHIHILQTQHFMEKKDSHGVCIVAIHFYGGPHSFALPSDKAIH